MREYEGRERRGKGTSEEGWEIILAKIPRQEAKRRSRGDISKRVPQITVTRDVYSAACANVERTSSKSRIPLKCKLSRRTENRRGPVTFCAQSRDCRPEPVGYVILCVKVHAHLLENPPPLFILPGVKLSRKVRGRINARRNEFELFPPLTFERYLKSCNCRAQPPASDKFLGVSRINPPGVKNVGPDLLHPARDRVSR